MKLKVAGTRRSGGSIPARHRPLMGARKLIISCPSLIQALGLEALIAWESARHLAKLGGTEKKLLPIRRRRLRKVT